MKADQPETGEIRQIEGLRYSPKWVTHLGCVKGCLDYLNMDISDGWLFGATGHAFLINIHEVVCPSGPTAWMTEMLFKLGRNIGYDVDGVVGSKDKSDFAQKQKLAWGTVRRAIDEGLPCYGWELDVPEFYVVYGYDEKGYYFRHFDNSGKGPKPWDEVGKTEIGVLEMYVVKPGRATDDRKTIREAFEFALEHSESPEKWILPKYKAGLEGFDSWIRAVETGEADGFGMAYNAAVWAECRHFAVDFLREVKERVSDGLGPLLDEAAGHYEVVAQNLKTVSETFPFPPKGEEIKDADRRKSALENLRKARQAEEAALSSLEKILLELH